MGKGTGEHCARSDRGGCELSCRKTVEVSAKPARISGFVRQDRERQLNLPGRDLAFPHLMNIVCKGDREAVSKLSPALHWIYKNIDLFAWRRMETREARKVFQKFTTECYVFQKAS